MTMNYFTRRCTVILLTLLLFGMSVIAQNAGQEKPSTSPDEAAALPQNVIRANTRLVVVDLVAVDEKGGPVADLKKEDFTVTEDGIPQQIADFGFWRPVVHPQAAPALQAGVVSNAPLYRAATSYNIILLDAINT